MSNWFSMMIEAAVRRYPVRSIEALTASLKPTPPDTLRKVLGVMRAPVMDPERIVTRYVVAEPGTSPASGATGAAVKEHGKHCRVLLAEDNAVNQRVAVLMLQRLGCRVDVASNGQEALKLVGPGPGESPSLR
jgi:PleD family two-component response regulator